MTVPRSHGSRPPYRHSVLVAGQLRPLQNAVGHGWRTPVCDTGRTLFPVESSIALAEAGVSRDELARWNAAGWISEELLHGTNIDQPEFNELTFVRDVARSGLSDAQVTHLLSQLHRPYSYDPTRIAYSFAYGWVQLPIFYEEKEVRDFVDDFIEDWIRDTLRIDPGRLDKVRDLITEALENADLQEADETDDQELEQ